MSWDQFLGLVLGNAATFTDSTPLLVEGWTPCLSTCRVRGKNPGLKAPIKSTFFPGAEAPGSLHP
jgi:hypothetical protein